jgi:hypothetical protein
MGKFGYGSWTLPRLTDTEKFHAAILYSRPDGNADLDIDPTSWLFTVISVAARSRHRWRLRGQPN